MIARHEIGVRRCGRIKRNADSTFEATSSQAFFHRARKRGQMGLHRVGTGLLHGRIKAAHRPVDKSPDPIGTAEQVTPTLPFRCYFLWLQNILSEASSGPALSFLSIAPARFHLFGGFA